MTTTTAEDIAPGIHDGIPSEDYHRGPGISSSGLKRLLPPYTPAHYRYGEYATSAAMDFGKVAHRLVLGDGDSFAVSPFDSFRSKEAREWKAEQEAQGVVIVSEAELATAQAMAAAVHAHPTAGPLFDDGKAEQSLYWTDDETGVLCRARVDWLRNLVEGRRLIVPDYKSARTAARDPFGRAAADFGYIISARFYLRGCKALGLDPDPVFVLVAQEKVAPYLIGVYTPDDEDLEHADQLISRGLRLYADCLANDTWPGYPTTVQTLPLPVYHRIKTEEYLTDVDN
jgi:hypothetical protein